MNSTKPRPTAATFRLLDRGYADGEVRLQYAFDDGPPMIERVRFPGAPAQVPAGRETAFARALELLHGIAGVSYYKALVPERIEVAGEPLDPALTDLLDETWLQGLGEFAHHNGLDLRARIRFPRGSASTAAAPSLKLPRRALVPIGGGKDSLVSIETLKRAGEAFAVVWIGRSDLIRACAQATGQPLLNIERELAPELFELNRQGAWNGHIPVTAINSAILTLAALLYGYDEIVFSNEASASVGNLTSNELDINHQWSKGLRFEARFGDYLRTAVAADLNYYSLLRPLSELAVTERFAALTRYHGLFSSCNRNFRILGAKPSARWCGECPKCRFVFLALAPFMSKPALLAIFGRNLLDEPEQIDGFDALLEFGAIKPFECVGEGRESRAALLALSERADWREDLIVHRFVDDILPAIDRSGLALAPQLQPAGEHRIPQRLWPVLGIS
ncbi:MAG: endonuclease domain-containing protein [Rhodanobacteraceae bacterium]|nr:endonuclease domain-containing protein [Rhodanobacteraceae bacterium]